MENASKALLIAGAMLLLMLVLTFTMYMFKKIGGDTSDLYGQIEESEITEFNQQFLKFETRRDSENKVINPLRIQDVVSIINLVRDTNKRQRFPVEMKITFMRNRYCRQN